MAVDNDFFVFARDLGERGLAEDVVELEMYGIRNVAGFPVGVLAHIDERHAVAEVLKDFGAAIRKRQLSTQRSVFSSRTA